MAVVFLGINNCSSVIPNVARERTVMYREGFAGMYSPWAYALAQVHMNFTSFFMLAFCSTHKEFCNVLFLLIIFLI